MVVLWKNIICRAAILSSYICLQHYSLTQASGDNSERIDFKEKREKHTFKTHSKAKYERLAKLSDMEYFKKHLLAPLLIERVSDTDGNLDAQEHIKLWMGDRLNWHIEEDAFEEWTPYSYKNFRNIIATQDPEAQRFLTLACHFDSKYFLDFKFIGATDSAVPCAMMIDVARTLNHSLFNGKDEGAEGVSLRFIFFDGEEAFKEWTDADSIYGARHLANKWHKTPHPHDELSTVLDGLDALVLLDLIGTANPRFRNFFPDTDKLFKRLQSIESKLHKQGLLEEHRSPTEYFTSNNYHGGIEDDHIPFLKKGVPILHMIAAPFPSVWHKESDNESALHYKTIDNLNKILRVLVAEYLHLHI